MDPRRIKFDEEITRLNGDHVKWYTSESIKDMIEKIKGLKDGTPKKTPNDYKLLKPYDVVDIAHFQKLIVCGSDPVRYFVPLEDLFNVINEAHIACGHGGEKRMEKELKKKYICKRKATANQGVSINV